MVVQRQNVSLVELVELEESVSLKSGHTQEVVVVVVVVALDVGRVVVLAEVALSKSQEIQLTLPSPVGFSKHVQLSSTVVRGTAVVVVVGGMP